MATVFDAAKFILERKGQMSTMKLQKLCYYAQVWSLLWDDYPLFDEDFEAWANGPVCPELFYYSQGKFSVDANNMKGDSDNLTENQKDTVQRVLDFYGEKNAQWLSQLTHMEAPWKDARQGIPNGSPSKAKITKESMAMYSGCL